MSKLKRSKLLSSASPIRSLKRSVIQNHRIRRVYCILAVWRFKPFLSVGCGLIRIYLPVYAPEIIGGFGLEEKKTKLFAV